MNYILIACFLITFMVILYFLVHFNGDKITFLVYELNQYIDGRHKIIPLKIQIATNRYLK